jgi:hypothetical protein
MSTLANALDTLNGQQQRESDRRRFRRVPLCLTGRILDEQGAEYDCRTVDVSPGDARISAPQRPTLGGRVIMYLKDLGRLEGCVARMLADGAFAIRFSSSIRKREKITDQLTLLINPGLTADDRRPGSRWDGGGSVDIVLDNGQKLIGQIVDFSLLGVAVTTAQGRPLLGAWVQVGQQYGRVARYFDGGFAVDFQSTAFRAGGYVEGERKSA